MGDEIVFTPESVAKIADLAATEALKRIDLKAIEDHVLARIPTPKNGENGRNLILDDALRADVISAVAGLVPPPKAGAPGMDGRDGESYILKSSDREEIAGIASQGINVPTMDEIVEAASDVLVSREVLQRGVKRLELMIQQARDARRGGGGGISGQEMVEAINKALGNDRWQGGLMNVVGGVSFDGTSTPPITIHMSQNIASVDDLNTGHYRINFINPIEGAYLPVTGYGHIAAASRTVGYLNPTPTSLEVRVYFNVTPSDITYINMIIFQ